MMDAIQAQNIHLPKGGGAITGIGETFSPNAFSGTASMTIPIPVSPCRGFEPALALQYSSGGGNGAFGLGFSLTTPAISCATNKGTPLYDGSDHYVMDGNYLVPLKNPERKETLNAVIYTVQNYAPRQLSDFSLIELWQPAGISAATAFWKVTSREHVISIFGKTAEAQIANPEAPNQIFSWLLQDVYDAKGDHQLYKYKKENTFNVDTNAVYERNRSVSAQRYLSKVCYGNPDPIAGSVLLNDGLSGAEIKWHFEIVFNYGEYTTDFGNNANPYKAVKEWSCRPDPFSSYQAGFEVRTYRRCEGVLLFHRFDELDKAEVLVQSSAYRYDDLKQANGFISQLTGVTDAGHILKKEKYESAFYPELELGYSAFLPEGHSFDPLDAASGSMNGLTEAPYTLVDLFGHGIPGILYADGQSVSYREPVIEFTEEQAHKTFSATADLAWKNNEMKYGKWQAQAGFPITKSISGEGLSLGDQTGNGQPDLVLNLPGINSYWQANADGSWTRSKTFEQFPLMYAAPNQTQLNATGAGLSDLLQIRNNKTFVYPSAREKGFAPAITQEREQSMPATLQSSEVTLLQFADMAGSGTPQFVKVEKGKVLYWPNFGYGRFGKPVDMGNAPQFPEHFNTQRLFLADVDGSGTADLLYVEADKLFIYFNKNGNSFSEPLTIKLPYAFDSLDNVSFVDVYGQGTTCLILSFPHGLPGKGDLSPRFLCYDFCQHKKPYLMNAMKNNMGTETSVEYASSVDYYLADKKNGVNWITNIPFPVQVIAKTTIHDVLTDSKHTSQYAYHHGYYDGEEREFKGFGRVDEQDTEYFFSSGKPDYAAPVLNITWYNVGCPEEQYKSLLQQYEKEYYKGDPGAFPFPASVIDCADIQSRTQAYAALAGTVIHAEVYGLDDSVKDKAPYTVTENSYKVSLRQAKDTNWYAVFFVQARESRSYTYDRDPADPQVQQQFTLEVDTFGNVKKEASIAYPRRGKQAKTDCEIGRLTFEQQYTTKIVCSINQYINNSAAGNYLLGLPCESQSYQVMQPGAPAGGAFTFDTITAAVDKTLLTVNKEHASSKDAELISWDRVLYAEIKAGETSAMPLGKAALPVLPYQSQVILDDQQVLSGIYEGVLKGGVLAGKLEEGYYNFDKDSGYWWNIGGTQEYFDGAQFYLPAKIILSYRGLTETIAVTSYEYDAYHMNIKKITDALGNVTAAETDYRLMQPWKITDANECSSEVSFDALGQVIYTSVYGYEEGMPAGFEPVNKAPQALPKSGSEIIANPEKYLGNMQSYFYYDLFAYQNSRKPPQKNVLPVYALSLRAVNYPATSLKARIYLDVAPVQIQVAYSDGLGRELQTKALTGQEKDQWVTSGKKYYNNKGDVIKEYEPYFTNTFSYAPAEEQGVSSTLFYDPLGRLIRTLTPKGFLLLQNYSSWHTETWDANDSILQSPYYLDNIEKPDAASPFYDKELTAAGKENMDYIAAYFADTPETGFLDNMGNVIAVEKINRFIGYTDWDVATLSEKVKQLLVTFNLYDIAGRLIKSSDPRLSKENIWNFEMEYAIGVEAPLRTKGVDAGTGWILPDVMGNIIFSCDSRMIVTTTGYDELQRSVKVHVKKEASEKDPLHIDQVIQHTVYGDTRGLEAPARNNLKGQVYDNYESSGLVSFYSYSLTGLPLKATQRFFKDYTKQGNWDAGNTAMPKSLLQNNEYLDTARYDALGRATEETDSDGNCVSPEYYAGGWLNKLQIKAGKEEASNYVNGISYDAKGQRLTIDYGNQTRTLYSYDPKTFEAIQIRTCRIEKNKQEGSCLQDIGYQYDPVGNVFRKETFSQDPVFYKSEKAEPVCAYLYDAVYQLIQATGREKAGAYNSANPETGSSLPDDLMAIQNYVERYSYDRGGNLTTNKHIALNNRRTKRMAVSGSSNRSVEQDLKSEKNDVTPGEVDSFFDAAGNQLKLKNMQQLQWDCMDRLQKVTVAKHADGSQDVEYYVYNSGGQRVRKINESYGNGGEVLTVKQTYYLGNLEIRETRLGADAATAILKEEYHSLRLLDGNQGVATRSIFMKGKPEGFTSPVIIYHLQDHLGSYTTQVSESGVVIASEEYSPFGSSTLFMGTGAAELLSHYRYSGKERDSVTGFYYYGARYYAPWLYRWLNPDPAGTIDGLNVYAFVGNNPVTFEDVRGMNKKLTKKQNEKTFHKNVSYWNQYIEYPDPAHKNNPSAYFDMPQNASSKSSSSDLKKNTEHFFNNDAEFKKVFGKLGNLNPTDIKFGKMYENQHVIPQDVSKNHSLTKKLKYSTDNSMNNMLAPTPNFIVGKAGDKINYSKKTSKQNTTEYTCEDMNTKKDGNILFTGVSAHRGNHSEYNKMITSKLTQIEKNNGSTANQNLALARFQCILRTVHGWGLPIYKSHLGNTQTLYGSMGGYKEKDIAELQKDYQGFDKMWTRELNEASKMLSMADKYKANAYPTFKVG